MRLPASTAAAQAPTRASSPTARPQDTQAALTSLCLHQSLPARTVIHLSRALRALQRHKHQAQRVGQRVHTTRKALTAPTDQVPLQAPQSPVVPTDQVPLTIALSPAAPTDQVPRRTPISPAVPTDQVPLTMALSPAVPTDPHLQTPPRVVANHPRHMDRTARQAIFRQANPAVDLQLLLHHQ